MLKSSSSLHSWLSTLSTWSHEGCCLFQYYHLLIFSLANWPLIHLFSSQLTIDSSFHLPTDHWFIVSLANWPLIHIFSSQLTIDSLFHLPTDHWFIFFIANWPLIHLFYCQLTTDSSVDVLNLCIHMLCWNVVFQLKRDRGLPLFDIDAEMNKLSHTDWGFQSNGSVSNLTVWNTLVFVLKVFMFKIIIF